MSRKQILTLCLSVLTALALLSACGGSPSSTAPADSSGSAAAPTSAPASANPTEAPVSAEPTAAPAGSAPDPDETEGESPNEPKPVLPRTTPAIIGESPDDPGALVPFNQRTGLFAIDIPEGWTAEETSDSDRVQSVFRSPDLRSFLAVYLNESSNFANRDQLRSDLEEYLSQELGTAVEVKISDPDGSGRLPVDFSYNLPDDTTGHTGRGYVANRGNLISFVIFSTPSDQFNLWSETLANSADSLVLSEDASLK
jgi:hypothetical protein